MCVCVCGVFVCVCVWGGGVEGGVVVSVGDEQMGMGISS